MLCSKWKLVSWSSHSKTHWEAPHECGSVFSLVCRGTKQYFTIRHWSNFPVLQQLTPVLTLVSPSLDAWLFIQYNYTDAQACTAMFMLVWLLKTCILTPSTHSGTKMLCAFHSHEPHLFIRYFQNNPHNRNTLQQRIYNIVSNIDLQHSLWSSRAKLLVTIHKTFLFYITCHRPSLVHI